jgi:hypothetical protein
MIFSRFYIQTFQKFEISGKLIYANQRTTFKLKSKLLTECVKAPDEI